MKKEGKQMKNYYVFPQGKTKVLTLSYDDGRCSDKKLVEIFNKYGIKATFNLNGGLFGNLDRIEKEEVREIYKGHEIATHTCSHPTITRCPMVQSVREIIDDRKELEAITGTLIRGHAYPNGVYNEDIKDVFQKLGIAYARTIKEAKDFGNYQNFDLPQDWMEWHPTCHHNHELMKHAEIFVNFKKPQYLKCMYVWGHSYEFDNDNNWELIENFCKYVSNREEIWYATNIEIRDYMEACERLQFSANEKFVFNPSTISVFLDVNEKIIEVPAGMMTRLYDET